MPKLPKRLYVNMEQDGKEIYPLATVKPEEIQDGQVGIYELKEIVTKRTETVLE